MAKEGISVKVTGIKEQQKRFRDKVKKVKQGLRKVVREAAKLIALTARSMAPKKTGALRKSIKWGAARRKEGVIGAIARPKVYYGSILESGWKTRTGKIVPPHPFMRPAYDLQKEAAAQLIIDFINKEVQS